MMCHDEVTQLGILVIVDFNGFKSRFSPPPPPSTPLMHFGVMACEKKVIKSGIQRDKMSVLVLIHFVQTLAVIKSIPLNLGDDPVMSTWALNCVILALNGINLGFLKIIFSTFWLGEPKCTETDLLKIPDLADLGQI